MVMRLALRESAAVAPEHHKSRQNDIILGADTIVVIGNRDPWQTKHARSCPRNAPRITRPRTRRNHGIRPCSLAIARIRSSRYETTRVWFSQMSDAEIEDYVPTGEPLDKAGAYAIQGIAGRYIPRIEGCYFNVVGLPIARVWAMLLQLSETKSQAS